MRHRCLGKAMILVLGLVLAGGAATHAVASADMSRQDMLKLVLAQDVDGVESAMARAHEDFVAGRTDDAPARELSRVFHTTSPVISDFVEDWLRQHPESAHAHAAQAQVYRRIAWSLRGDRHALSVHYVALQAFDHLMLKANDHAMTAFGVDPAVLAASDVLIETAVTGHGSFPLLNILGTVMERHPNAESLKIALLATNGNWGGSQGSGDHFCEAYGPMVPGWEEDGVTICKLMVSARHYDREPREWFVDALTQTDHPALKPLRIRATLHLNLDNSAWQQELESIFDDPTFTDLGFAQTYDGSSYMSHHPNAPLATPRVAARAVEWALKEIEHDPYNWQLLNILSTTSIWRRYPDGSVMPQVFRDGKPAMPRDEIARRRVLSRPYTARAWTEYAKQFDALDTDEDEGKWYGSYINAVVYSNYRGYILTEMHNLLAIKTLTYDNLLRASKDMPEKHAALLAVDKDTVIHCPLIRARRVLDAMCERHPTMSGCPESGVRPVDISEVIRDVDTRNVCLKERRSPIEDLYYTPVAFDLVGADGN